MMKVLITGASGFTGSHLVKHLQQNPDLIIYCVNRNKLLDGSYVCELTNYESVDNLIQEIQPDQIYHLAGSFSNDYDIDYANNVLTTKNILDSLLKHQVSCRVLLIGSAAEYGLVKEEDNPVKEGQPLNPVSIYGLTKVYQTHLMNFYCQVRNLDIVMARTFNLLGRNTSNHLFIGRVYQQIEEYKKGKVDKIILGDLQSKRDYVEIQEAVECYEKIMNYGNSGNVYNVGKGSSIRLSDLLKKVLAENHLSIDIVDSRMKNHTNKINVNDIFADLSKINIIINSSLKSTGN
jgi:nucleoside-diphosphate-sugar epimerase